MDHLAERDRTEEVETVVSLSAEIPYLTEDMIDAAMNKHLNYQTTNGNEHQLSMEEESLDSEECWTSNKRSSNETKESDCCDRNNTSDMCNIKNGSESEVINNENNFHVLSGVKIIKLNETENSEGSTFITEEVHVSGLDQSNDITKKDCQHMDENVKQTALPKVLKTVSMCTKSKELNTNDACLNGSSSCYNMDHEKCENKSKSEVNCNGLITSQESSVCGTKKNCRPDSENILLSGRFESEQFYHVSDDDTTGDDEDSCSMRLDDELKKTIENNLIKEIGPAFNINSSRRVCSDVINKAHEKSISVNRNKQQCETVTLYNSVGTNKIIMQGDESNITFSKQQEHVKINITDMKETGSAAVTNSLRREHVGNMNKLGGKSTYLGNKQNKYETVTMCRNGYNDKGSSGVFSEKNVSFQNSDIISKEDSVEPSCSYNQQNSATNSGKKKILASDKTKGKTLLGKFNTPTKVIVIKKNNLSRENYKLCDDSQILQGKNLKLLVSPNIKNTSQSFLDESNTSVLKSPFKVVPVQKTTSGVVQLNSNENFVETAFKKQILVSQIPAYSTPGLVPTRAFKCDYCGDRFSVECSLKQHLNRQSVEIIYWCRVCCLNIQFFNRCKMISHIKAHGQHIKNIDSSCVTLKPLPKHLIDLGLPKYALKINGNSELTMNVQKEQGKTKCQNDSTQAQDCSGQVFGKNCVRDEKELNTHPNDSECIKDKTDSNKHAPKAVVLTIPAYTLLPPKTANNISKVQKSKVVLLTKIPSKKTRDLNIVQSSENLQDDIHPDVNIKSKTPEHAASVMLVENNKGNSIEATAINKNVNKAKNLKRSNKQTNMKKHKHKSKGSYCNECKHVFTDIVRHLKGENSPAKPENTCPSCQLILPTKCALWFHMRIHTKIPPFRCPECGKDFNNFDLFSIHLKYICGHLSKIVTYVCSLCDTYYLNLSSLKTHIYNFHSVNIYKCNLCSFAFFSPFSVNSHKKQGHPNVGNVSFGFYRQCKMCPDRLVPRAKFTDHVNYHCRQSKHCTYQYMCDICKVIITGKEDFLTHQSKCLNNQQKKTSIRESDTEKSVEYVQSENVDTSTDCVIVEEEIMLNKDDACSDIMVVPEKDPLSLEDWEGCEDDIVEETVETCVVCKEQPVIFVPGTDRNSQSLCCKQCVRPCFPSSGYMSQSIEMVGGQLNYEYDDDYDDDDVLSDLEKKTHYKHLRQKRKNDIQTSSAKKLKFINNVSLSHSGKESKLESGAEGIQCQKSDIAKNKKSKIRKQGKHDARGDGRQSTFACGQVMAATSRSSDWSCCKCQFTTSCVEDFHRHVVLHRTDPDDFQCLECGLCFVVQPSLEKHLLFQHQIKDIKDYIAKNNVCDRIKQESDKISENQCCVCYEIFDSKLNLDLHFRTHGMAFLSKNKLDMSC